MKKRKISLIGAGNIGGTLAHLSILKELGDVILLDINAGIAKGKALDLAQSTSVSKNNVKIMGTDDYSNIANSDVIIITAGIPRKPGMSRDDLVSTNTKIISQIGSQIKRYSPKAFVICVTNPLDVMVWVLQQSSDIPKNKIVGMAGVLDSARFAHFIADALNVAISDVQAFVLGGHGDTMVPLLEYTTVSGISIPELIKMGLITKEVIDNIVIRTRNGGAEVVELLGTGSAFYAPATSAISMAESYLFDQKRILPAAAWVDGSYGVKGLFVGVPTIIGNTGVEKIIEVPLDTQSAQNLHISINEVKQLMEVAKKLL